MESRYTIDKDNVNDTTFLTILQRKFNNFLFYIEVNYEEDNYTYTAIKV